MKNISHVLDSLRHKPQFSRLSRSVCIGRIKTLFPPHLQKLIRYGYLHNDVLYFVLSHPGAKQEFDNIIYSIKEPLKRFKPQECKEFNIKDIRAFVTHTPPAQEYVKKTVPLYKERSKANFSNFVKDSELHAIIERIRQTIEC